MHFLPEWKLFNFNKGSLKSVPYGLIDKMSALVRIIAWHQTCDKPLSDPMTTQFSDTYVALSTLMCELITTAVFHWVAYALFLNDIMIWARFASEGNHRPFWSEYHKGCWFHISKLSWTKIFNLLITEWINYILQPKGCLSEIDQLHMVSDFILLHTWSL